MSWKSRESQTNVFLYTDTNYEPATYEDLITLVRHIVTSNESGLDDDINSLKVGICDLKPKIEYLLSILKGDEPKTPERTNITIDFSDTNLKPGVEKKVSYKRWTKDQSTNMTPPPSFHVDRRSVTTSTNSKETPRLESDSTTGNYGSWGSFGLCSNRIGEVKIWFQNRRMKWKRSKKAQQESKNTKDSDKSHSPVSTNAHCQPKRSASQEPCTSTQTHSTEGTPRKNSNESEQLYRPYVV